MGFGKGVGVIVMIEMCLASTLQSPETKVTEQPVTALGQQQLSLGGLEISRVVLSGNTGILGQSMTVASPDSLVVLLLHSGDSLVQSSSHRAHSRHGSVIASCFLRLSASLIIQVGDL